VSDDEIARLQRRVERERTARREAERIAEKGLRELYLANQELDRRVAERTAELDRALVRAEQAADARAEFLVSLSRQVRTPLNGVLGMLELLDGHVFSEQAKLWVGSASASASDLLRLVSRLLLFVELDESSDAGAGATCEVAGLLGRIDERWSRPSVAAGKLLFVDDRTPPDTVIDGAAARLEQLLGEVIDNAVRHGEAGSIRVAVEARDDRVVIDVADDGPGLSEPERLLDPAAEPDRPVEQQGMGYPLIRKLALRLGAAISHEGDGPGTTVRVSLLAGAKG